MPTPKLSAVELQRHGPRAMRAYCENRQAYVLDTHGNAAMRMYRFGTLDGMKAYANIASLWFCAGLVVALFHILIGMRFVLGRFP